MNKLYVLLFLYSIHTLAFDKIEKAILDSNPKELSLALQSHSHMNGPLSERKLIKYLDLAQQIIIKRQDQIYFDKIYPEHKSVKGLVGGLGLPLSLLFMICLPDPRNSDQINHQIVTLFVGSFIASLTLLIWGIKDIHNYHQETKDLYEQSLVVKQLIYEA